MLRIVADSGDGFHAPSLDEFYPPALFGEGTFYEFNRVMMVRLIAAVLLVGIMVFVARRATVVPTRGQRVVEIIIDYIRAERRLSACSARARARSTKRCC